MATRWFLVILAIGMYLIPACTRHRVEVAPVEVKPIHITIDVNIKVDRALDDFFGDLDEKTKKSSDPSVQE